MTVGLFLGHPGHELVVHGWVARVRPLVFVLTDGSGSSSVPRLASSRRVLEDLDAPIGTVFGAMSDRDAYQAITRGDAEPFVSAALRAARELAAAGAVAVASDAIEGYNPVHDLARLLADEIARTIARWTARPVARLEIGLVDPPLEREGPSPPVCITLDDDEWARKRAAAEGYAELRQEFDTMLASRGVEGLRTEVLLPVHTTHPFPGFGGTARYEAFGRERVARGLYAEVLGERRHLDPVVAKVRAALSTAAPESP